VIGLVIDANRKIESRAIGAPPRLAEPTAATSILSPRATRPTAPGSVPLLTWVSRTPRRSVITSPPVVCLQKPATRSGPRIDPRTIASGESPSPATVTVPGGAAIQPSAE